MEGGIHEFSSYVQNKKQISGSAPVAQWVKDPTLLQLQLAEPLLSLIQEFPHATCVCVWRGRGVENLFYGR